MIFFIILVSLYLGLLMICIVILVVLNLTIFIVRSLGGNPDKVIEQGMNLIAFTDQFFPRIKK